MEIIKQLYQLLLRRREPHDLNYDLHAAAVLIMAMLLLKYAVFVVANSIGNVFSNPLGYSLLSVLGQCGAVYLMLKIARKESRFVQTITALFGMYIFLVIILALMAYSVILVLAAPIVFFWVLYIQVLVFRSSFECPMFLAIGLMLIYLFAETAFIGLVFTNFEIELNQFLELMKTSLEAAQLEAQSQ
jgi:hypothetical protein